MAGFRVTKYNPLYRTLSGAYCQDEWTSLSDVGRAFNGRVVTCSDYLRMEDSYVQALRCLLASARLETFRVEDLRINEIDDDANPCGLNEEMRAHAGKVVEGSEVAEQELDWIVRLALREALWCRLTGNNRSYIHFGFDYYMYFGSDNLDVIPPVMPQGIFAEVCDSPHHREHSDSEDS